MGNQTGDKVYYLKGLMPDVLDSESDIYDGSKVLRDEHLYLYDNKVMFTTCLLYTSPSPRDRG